MTAVATAVGMVPIALQWAIGLERLSPLAVVAIGGLMVSTLLTLIDVPVFCDTFEKLRVPLLGGGHAIDGAARAERHGLRPGEGVGDEVLLACQCGDKQTMALARKPAPQDIVT